MFTVLGCCLYKYVMLMCNCRSEVFCSSRSQQAAYTQAQAQVPVQGRRGAGSPTQSSTSSRSAEAVQLFQEVDILFDGPEMDKERAYERLSEYEPEVRRTFCEMLERVFMDSKAAIPYAYL